MDIRTAPRARKPSRSLRTTTKQHLLRPLPSGNYFRLQLALVLHLRTTPETNGHSEAGELPHLQLGKDTWDTTDRTSPSQPSTGRHDTSVTCAGEQQHPHRDLAAVNPHQQQLRTDEPCHGAALYVTRTDSWPLVTSTPPEMPSPINQPTSPRHYATTRIAFHSGLKGR